MIGIDFICRTSDRKTSLLCLSFEKENVKMYFYGFLEAENSRIVKKVESVEMGLNHCFTCFIRIVKKLKYNIMFKYDRAIYKSEIVMLDV